MLRVLVADDHRLTLEAIKGALREADGIRVVADAESGRQALALVERTRPDVAVIDMNMPGAIDGLVCAERIRKRFPEVRVVLISAFTDAVSVRAAMRRGAHAFISKAVDPGDIPAALRQVTQGTVFHWFPEPDEEAREAEGLTKRELAILQGVAAGFSNAAIAKEMWVSQHTVKFHLTNIFRKLGVTNRTEAARLAYERRLVMDPHVDELVGVDAVA